MIKWCLSLLLLMPLSLKADLNDDLNKFFNKAGALVNSSSGEIYKGQKAGYMTGGGLTVRNRVMNVKPLTINMPRFDAGCGGIDIFSGGFSFINSDQLVETLKSVGSSSMGYAFMLGLETVSPQVSSVIKNLQTWSNYVNAHSIQSCEMAHQLVGSVWPRRTRANQEICRTLAGENGRVSDYIASRRGCAQENLFLESMKSREGRNDLKGFFRDEMNITWEALNKQSLLASNKQLKELFMTLMGTIVYRKGEETSIERIPPKIGDESFLSALIQGGDIEIKTCSDKECLRVQDTKIDLSSNSTWLSKIRENLLEIQKKILRDEELSAEEKELLTKTRFPLYKIVNVLTSYRKGYCPIEMYHVAEVVAMDLLTQFLREVIEIVREGAYQLRNEKMFGDEIDEYLKDLKRVEELVKYYETRSMQMAEKEFQMMQKIQLIEEQIRSEIMIY